MLAADWTMEFIVDGCNSSHRLAVRAQIVDLNGSFFVPSVKNVLRFVLDRHPSSRLVGQRSGAS